MTWRPGTLRLFLIVALSVSQPGTLSADRFTEGFAWSENCGWLNFGSTHSRGIVAPTHLSGYFWSENIGWVKFGAEGSGPYANSNSTDWGVNLDESGNLLGYAWSENVGWVNFAPFDGQVTIDPVTGNFDGYAWAENIGWVHFRNTSPAYEVVSTEVLFADGFESGDTMNWSSSMR